MVRVGFREHRANAISGVAVRVAVISVSDTRKLETDEGGALIEQLVTKAGFSVSAREVIPDEPQRVRACVRMLVFASSSDEPQGSGPSSLPLTVRPDAILVTGGTGVSPRDLTVEALAPLFDRNLDGFGELFRMLSYTEIGAAAMLSRACAGLVGQVPVFLIPGSPPAIRLAVERLILPELGHLLSELRRQPTPAPSTDQTEDRPGEATTEQGLDRHGSAHRHHP
jgi:molybdenum cofactor biosynthesis protein B